MTSTSTAALAAFEGSHPAREDWLRVLEGIAISAINEKLALHERGEY